MNVDDTSSPDQREPVDFAPQGTGVASLRYGLTCSDSDGVAERHDGFVTAQPVRMSGGAKTAMTDSMGNFDGSAHSNGRSLP